MDELSLIHTHDGWRPLERPVRTPTEAKNWRGFEMKVYDELAQLCPALEAEMIARQANVFARAAYERFKARFTAADA